MHFNFFVITQYGNIQFASQDLKYGNDFKYAEHVDLFSSALMNLAHRNGDLPSFYQNDGYIIFERRGRQIREIDSKCVD